MEVAKYKNKHKKIFVMFGVAYVLVLSFNFFVVAKPGVAEKLATSLFTPSIHISPSSNGLAKLEPKAAEEESHLGVAVEAGERVHSQLNLMSQ